MSTNIMVAVVVVIIIICAYFLNSKYFLYTSKYVGVQTAMRQLWSEHVIWTRQTIISAVDSDPTLSQVQARLMRNSADMSNAIAPLVGSVSAAKAKTLLDSHLSIAVQLVQAMIAKSDTTTLMTSWKSNAADIAAFFGGLYSPVDGNDMLTMMNMHLTLTAQEATELIAHNSNPATFDSIYSGAMTMADGLSTGIGAKYWYRFIL